MEEEITIDISFTTLEMIEEIHTYKSEYSKKLADKKVLAVIHSKRNPDDIEV